MFYTVLIDRLDLVLFAILSLSTACYADFRVVRHLITRRVRCQIWTCAFTLMTIGIWGAIQVGEIQRARLRVGIEGVAPTYAIAMELLGHAKLTLETPPDDPIYLSIIDKQRKWLEFYPAITDIYTMRWVDGKIVLLVDSETDYNHDGHYTEEREARTPIGEVYSGVPEPMWRAIQGVSVFDDVPATDRWGTTVSAYTPMRDANGNIEGIAGVDFDAEDWVRTLLLGRGCVLSAALATLIGVVVLISVSHLQRAEIEVHRRFGEEMRIQKQVVEASLRQLQAYETELERAARLDLLTGLPNRSLFHQRLQCAFQDPLESGPKLAVLFLDFDGFKRINDTLGHDMGDRLLVGIADRLRAEIPNVSQSLHPHELTNTVARIGGDEFVVLLSNPTDMQEVEKLTLRLINVLGVPHCFDEHEVRCTASIGIAFRHPGHTTGDDLVRDADTAMYSAKSQGKSCYVVAASYQPVHERLSAAIDDLCSVDIDQLVVLS